VSPGAPRLAGHVLARHDDPGLPWHRVVRADGSLAQAERQRRLLEDEGVPFRGARVAMSVARLDPLDAA
jgi:methylated-DNA-protein-cysteine methyltransferase-like protein